MAFAAYNQANTRAFAANEEANTMAFAAKPKPIAAEPKPNAMAFTSPYMSKPTKVTQTAWFTLQHQCSCLNSPCSHMLSRTLF